MSEERPIGLMVAEKFFGLIVIAVGAITVNFTVTDPPENGVEPFSGVFVAAGLVLIAIGVFLLLAKAE